MTSSRNDKIDRAVEDRILDAAARALAVSSRPPGIAELARQAGVSRPTVYRRFADGDAVFRALWERTIRTMLADTPLEAADRAGLVAIVVTLADQISTDDALAQTLLTQPSLVARYLLDRLGTGQQLLLGTLDAAIERLQPGGTVRAGDPREMAAMTYLIAQSAVQSRHMIAERLPAEAWRRELGHAVDRYLAS